MVKKNRKMPNISDGTTLAEAAEIYDIVAEKTAEERTAKAGGRPVVLDTKTEKISDKVSMSNLVASAAMSADRMADKKPFNGKVMLVLAIVGCAAAVAVATCAALVLSNQKKAEPEAASVEGRAVASEDLSLDDYDTDIEIIKGGTYHAYGDFEHTIYVAAGESDDVTIDLDGAVIAAANSGGIVATSGKSLTINLNKDTENEISASGAAGDYDSAIYSTIPLNFSGDGSLAVSDTMADAKGIATVNNDLTFNGDGKYYITAYDDGINAGGDKSGKIAINGGTFVVDAFADGIDSNATIEFNGGNVFVLGSVEDGNAAIDSDGGFTINGGTVAAVGSHLLETPQITSSQYSISDQLETKVGEGTLVSLAADDGANVIAFRTNREFRTLVLSTPALSERAGQHLTFRTGGMVAGENMTTIALHKKVDAAFNSIYLGGIYTENETTATLQDFTLDSFVMTVGNIENGVPVSNDESGLSPVMPAEDCADGTDGAEQTKDMGPSERKC